MGAPGPASEVKDGLPELTRHAVQRLQDEGREWLDGSAAPGVPL